MEKKYKIRIEGELIELNSDEEYAELKKQYTNYKFMIEKKTFDIIRVKAKKQPQSPKPPQWFMYWSENVFVPFVHEVREGFRKVNERLDVVEQRLDAHDEIFRRNNLK